MNASLRRRLFVWLSLSIGIAGALAAVLSFVLAMRDANDLQDAQLQQIALVLSSQPLPPTPRFRPRDHEDAETHLVIKRLGAATIDPDPTIDLALSPSLPQGLQSLEQAGVSWRALVSRNAAGERFAVAQRMTVRDEEARQSALLTLLPLLVLVPVLLLIVGIVLRQAFEPMLAMSAQVDQLDAHQLIALDERHVPSEALPLVQAVNRMVRRLAAALDQQRRLVADAAHELRTPVAALIVQSDNVQAVELPLEARTRSTALRGGLARMAALIDQLLDFARVQGAAPASTRRLELTELVRAAIEATLPLAQSKGVDLGCVRNDAAAIRGDPLHAYTLVRNAIDNAVRYTPRGGTVDVSVSVEERVAWLVVEDSGPGIADADRERVFEPFMRVLGSQEAGSGLGLAIARTAAHALGGTIQLSRRRDGRSGLCFVYRQAAL